MNRRNFIVRLLVGIAVCAVVVGAALGGVCFWMGLVGIVGVFSVVELRRLRAFWAMVWVVGACAALVAMYMRQGMWPVLWYVFVIWANDVGAYLVGSTVGRRKLCPRVSPLKTWEGAFGGLAAGLGCGLAGSVLMGADIFFWLGLAVVAVVTGVLGDLAESMLKRRAGVKDSGAMLPGHGGMLDRFDALLFSAPFVLGYFILFS